MFRLHKNKSDKSLDRLDFKFSSFQALQVPKGWDRLVVSVVSAETAKTMSKSGKAPVRNGNCRWTETFLESFPVGECVIKFVVSTGSVRSGILGEATVNLASYTSSEVVVPVSLPLKKCNSGTVLQVKIQCQTPKTKLREERLEDRGSYVESSAVDDNDIENKSDVSNSSFSRSFGSSSSNRLDSASNTGEPHSMETSFSASGSRYSFDSMDVVLGRENCSPQSNSAGVVNYQIGRQDSTGSQNGSPYALNSKVSQIYSQNQKDDLDQAPHSVFSSHLRNAGSSKDLAEAKIEELHAEARMWEQNAKKLMINRDKLQDELNDRTKQHASLAEELSESRRECDIMKHELEQLKTLMEESVAAQKASEHKSFQDKEMENDQKELEDEIKFQKESNANLTLQLKKTQESNVELVAILEELEDIVEKQANEIANLSKGKSGNGLEGEGSCLLGDNDETNPSKQVLKRKIEELEKDCNELTDENLELALKLKELEEDLQKCSPASSSPLQNDSYYTSEFESEATKIKYQICELEEELNKKDAIIKELSADHLQIQRLDVEKRCADLELQLRASKEEMCYLDEKLHNYAAREAEQEIEIAELQQQLQQYQGKETKTRDMAEICPDLEMSKPQVDVGMAILSELYEQIESCLVNLRKKHHAVPLPQCMVKCNLGQQNEQAQSILNCFFWLTNILEAKISVCSDEHQQDDKVRVKLANAEEPQNKLNGCILEENSQSTSGMGLGCPQMESKPFIAESYEELLEKISEMDKIKSDNLLKEQEVGVLIKCQRKLETQILNLQKEKRQLEDYSDIMPREGLASQSLDVLQNEIVVPNSGMDSQVSSNKILVGKSSELENSINEMEVHLFELEKENVQLSERICGLEAQLRYLTDEKESCYLELRNSESHAVNLQEEIRRLESELEAQKFDIKQKLQDMQNKWLEAQKECEYLKMENPKLQTTAENLTEECSLLQKQNTELRQQKMELNDRCNVLEAELRESEKLFSDAVKNVEALEGKCTVILEAMASKETAIGLELDSLVQENMKYKEKLLVEESLLDQMYLEKTIEVENLQREVAQLTEEIPATNEDKNITASEAVHEVSRLRSDKAMVEASLQEVRGKLQISESNLRSLQEESERKVLKLMNELDSSKQQQEILMANHEKLLELLEDVRSNEEKHKVVIRDIELQLKASDYEKQQAEEEISNLKIQLQKTSSLQNEILALKRSMNEVEFENQRLAASLQMLSGDYEELKHEKTVNLKKISDMQRAVSDLEDCKRAKVALEEKVLRLEGDLTAKDALAAREAELKNELARVKRVNSELQRKLKSIEEENQQHLKRAKDFQEELNLRHDEAKPDSDCGSSQIEGVDPLLKIQQLENDLAEALEANDMYKLQLRSFLSERCKDNSDDITNRTCESETERVERIQERTALLEVELKDLQERYFHMSLKYAEVEAEREQLARKLKAAGTGRSWFSRAH